MIVFRELLRLRSFGLSAGLLVALLQRTPVLRTLVTVESQLAPSVGSLLRAVLAPAVALGAVHSLAGASTQLIANTTLPARATVGQPFSLSVAITGLGVSFAQSWDISNTLPPGVSPVGGVLTDGALFIITPSNGTLTLSGTPTAAGTYTFTAHGYQYTNRTGPITTGSTSIVVAAAPNSAPTILRQPLAQTATVGSAVDLSVSYTGVPAPTFQWVRDGTALAGATGPSLALARVTAADAGVYVVAIANSLGTVTSTAARLTVNAAPSAPVFARSPATQTAVAGGAVIFSVDVSGVPSPLLRWLKDGAEIAGATDTTLILNDLSATDAGLYSVIADNASGIVFSNAARLTVTPSAAPPAFSAHPAAFTAAPGSTVVFNAVATGTPAPALQWQRDGVNISGATSPRLVIGRTTAADAGAYRLVATNASGTITSSDAVLILAVAANPARLVNLSILTTLASGESLTLGTVLGGAGTGGNKALLARAAGPSLTQLGVTGILPDPQLSLVAGATNSTIAANNDWGGTTALSNAFSQVGAFAYASASSKDAAIVSSALAPGSYTVQVGDVEGAAGTVIAELYDSTPNDTVTSATPRLINVSVLKQISAGATLTAGFVIGGSTAKTVLVRAIGPGLAQFGVNGAMPDPKLALFSGQTKIAENDDWGGDAQVTSISDGVGAFRLSSASSKDAILLITLAPGSYSAQASGTGVGGAALVELYEVQ